MRNASRSWRTAQPDSIEELFTQALGLEARGRDAEAQTAYIEVIRRDGAHFDALINLGNLLNRTGYRRGGRLAYMEAVKAQPNNPIPHVNLGNTYLDTGELDAARMHFESALRIDPEQPEAHQGMSYVFARVGDERAASRHRELGFSQRAMLVFPYRGTGTPIRANLLVSALGGNVFTTDFLDERIFEVTRIFVEYYGESGLPEADLVFNAIGDADRCGAALRRVAELLASSRVPLVNPPEGVLETGRLRQQSLLSGIAGVTVPRAAQLTRNNPDPGDLPYPLLVRSPGFHTGMHFVRVDEPGTLRDAIAELPGDTLFAMQYLDARGRDGDYRKYRVMIVDGKLFPLHLAIAADWKVHYFTAGMAENPAHQLEEQKFLVEMADVLGPKAVGALEQIGKRLNLDYAGVDFGLDREGNILLFEANATMIVPSRETRPELAYRVRYLERILEAVKSMLVGKARAHRPRNPRPRTSHRRR